MSSTSGCSIEVVRVQAPDGRGQFRPGSTWYDTPGSDFGRPRPSVEVFPDFVVRASLYVSMGYHVATACDSVHTLTRWFSPTERKRLVALGYSPVVMFVDEVLFQNEDQLIVARRLPFRVGVGRLRWRALG